MTSTASIGSSASRGKTKPKDERTHRGCAHSFEVEQLEDEKVSQTGKEGIEPGSQFHHERKVDFPTWPAHGLYHFFGDFVGIKHHKPETLKVITCLIRRRKKVGRDGAWIYRCDIDAVGPELQTQGI